MVCAGRGLAVAGSMWRMSNELGGNRPWNINWEYFFEGMIANGGCIYVHTGCLTGNIIMLCKRQKGESLSSCHDTCRMNDCRWGIL